MSDERFSGHPSPAQQETANRGEIVAIEDLPVRLGFSETEELGQVRSQLVEAMVSNNTEAVKKLATRYHLLAEQVVNQRQGDDFPRAQIGLSVAMGLIRRDAGRIDDYLDDLEAALEYATNMGYEDIVSSLQMALPE